MFNTYLVIREKSQDGIQTTEYHKCKSFTEANSQYYQWCNIDIYPCQIGDGLQPQIEIPKNILGSDQFYGIKYRNLEDKKKSITITLGYLE